LGTVGGYGFVDAVKVITVPSFRVGLSVSVRSAEGAWGAWQCM